MLGFNRNCARMDCDKQVRNVWKNTVCSGFPRCGAEPPRTATPAELSSGCDQKQGPQGGMGQKEVLEHIILDMTGSSVAVEQRADASLQRTLRRTKRLLSRTNSVLCFRLIIMMLVACMLMVTTLLTWNFTKTYSGRSIRSLSFILRHQLLSSSLTTMTFVLGQVYNLSLVLNAMHQQALLAHSSSSWPTIERELCRINWGFFKSKAQLNSVAFLSKDGYATGYTRDGHSDLIFFANESSIGMQEVWYYQNVTGSPDGTVKLPPPISSTGPYADKFLSDIMIQNDVAWSIETGVLGEPIVSPAIPVKNPGTNKIFGMSVATATFQHLNDYLSTVDLLGGYLYFVWWNGSSGLRLIAASYDSPNDTLIDPKLSSNPVVAQAAQYLESMYSDLILLQRETHAEDVKLTGKRFYIDTMPLTQHFKNLNLTAVVIVPRSSIMGDIDARSKMVIWVSVGTAMGILVIGFFLICFLTRKMSTEMQLRQELIRQLVAKQRAEQSSNYKSQFLANMSHELRTPMAGIIGLLDLLACDTLTSEQEISVAQIRRCATGLLALVNNVLDISKVEAGKMELEVSPFNVMDELESLVDMFAAQSLGSNIDVTLDLSDEIPHVLKGDSARIRQIFSNLLSNSVKFTAQGHILIRGWVDQSLLSKAKKSFENHVQDIGYLSRGSIICHERVAGSESRVEDEKIVLVFEVDDTGCGIPTEIQETVFDRFVQADSSTTRIHGGSGLGLYIVRSLVNMMEGDILIAPKQGPGTRMRFHLVLDKVNSPGVMMESLHDNLSAVLGSTLKTLDQVRSPSPEILGRTQVLVAMPETITKSVAVHWLERRGMKVVSVREWDEIMPTLDRMCKMAVKDHKVLASGRQPPETQEYSQAMAYSPASQLTFSGGSSSYLSEGILECNRGPILALIDVGLTPGGLPSFRKVVSKDADPSVREALLGRVELEKIPSYIQKLMDCLQEIQTKHDVMVGWVAAPDSGPHLKQMLLSVPSSIVLNKPLHCSRMRRLLSLLGDIGRLDQPHSEALSYLSSDPSTPRLTCPSSPLKDVHKRLETLDMFIGKTLSHESSVTFSLNQTSGSDQIGTVEDSSGWNEEDRSPNSPGNEELLLDGQQNSGFPTLCHMAKPFNIETLGQPALPSKLFVRLSHVDSTEQDSTPTTPGSPTSGLITPEGANTKADGVQEVKKEGTYARELENEWKGPVIDLKIPSNGRGPSKQYAKSPSYTPDQTSVSVSAGESPSTTEPPSPPGSTIVGGIVPGALASMHILLVEDTPVLQRLASMMLKKLGAQVTVVSDGLQAVEAVAQAVKACEKPSAIGSKDENMIQLQTSEEFDLILMDCAMPVMDGYSATRAIREAELHTARHIPIVALTAHALASDEEKCLAVGMDAYLTKPINCKKMVATIQGLVLREKR